MARLKAANNARTTLAQTIDATVTSFTVADASIFPDPPFRITIDDEIMEVGAKDNATNTFSNVIRGVENTISASHDSGAVVENRFTAGTLAELIDANEAQAKVDTHAILNQTHGIGTGYYIAKTSRTDQLPAWIDIPDKPTAFNPIAHKTTHAIGGADALTPADIGAVKNTAGVPELLADVLANRPTAGVVGRLFFATDTGEIYRDNGTTWDLAAASRDGLAAHLADNEPHADYVVQKSGDTMTGNLDVPVLIANGSWIKVNSPDGNSHYELLNNGVRRALIYWENTTGELRLRKYDTDGVTILAEMALDESALELRNSDLLLANAAIVQGIQRKRGDRLSYLYIDFPDLVTQGGRVRFFRETNTTGTLIFEILKGDGTSAAVFYVDARAGSVKVNGNEVWHMGNLGLACVIKHSANQAIATNTFTKLVFDTEEYDPLNMHDPTTNNTRITIPQSGKYLVVAQVRFDTTTGGTIRQAEILKNGTTVIANERSLAASGVTAHFSVVTMRNFTAGDYLEVRVYQDSGATVNIEAVDAYSPIFSVVKVG